LGAVFVIFLGELLADYHTFHLAITGVLLIVIIRFIPGGIWGEIRRTRIGRRSAARANR
jgi:ABC-type branched-subunit amino acid transport system permease subunit